MRKIKGKKAFLANLEHQYHASQWGENDCSANNKKNRDYFEHRSLAISWVNINYKENDEKKLFLQNLKHQYHVSQCGEHGRSTNNKKKWRLLCASKFVSFLESILIVRKMVERKAFVANPKHQCRIS